MIELAVIIAIAGAVITMISLYVVYVHLIQKKNKVKEAVGGIDVQLKKRYDLIHKRYETLVVQRALSCSDIKDVREVKHFLVLIILR